MRDRLQPWPISTHSHFRSGLRGLRGYSALVPEEFPQLAEVTSELQRVTRQVGM